MVLRVAPQVIEDALLPKPLHSIPILHLQSPFHTNSIQRNRELHKAVQRRSSTHLAITDGVAEAVGAAGAGPRQRLLPDVEVEVGHDPGAVLREPVPLGGGAPGRRLRGGG